ncbi:hypothetical protein ACFYZJ_31035 [Streptomyces sp. NPDC001848]|uniref:hypothetical protein n=1 Tax=Streptomyces sp. NPDC001848 TaxID=3364618 RepID=UPI003681EA95
MFDRWSAVVAAAAAHSTLKQKRLQLSAFLSYPVNPAYGWAPMCREMFGAFPAMVLAELNSGRRSQGYVGRPSRNRPLTRPEVRAFFGQMDPEIARLRDAGHNGALAAAFIVEADVVRVERQLWSPATPRPPPPTRRSPSRRTPPCAPTGLHRRAP